MVSGSGAGVRLAGAAVDPCSCEGSRHRASAGPPARAADAVSGGGGGGGSSDDAGGVGSGRDTAARHRWESCATSLAAATSAASSSICMVRWPRTVAATRMAICTMLTHPRPPIRNFVTLHLDRLGRAMPSRRQETARTRELCKELRGNARAKMQIIVLSGKTCVCVSGAPASHYCVLISLIFLPKYGFNTYTTVKRK